MEAPMGSSIVLNQAKEGPKKLPQKSKNKGMDRPYQGLAVVFTTGTRTAVSLARA